MFPRDSLGDRGPVAIVIYIPEQRKLGFTVHFDFVLRRVWVIFIKLKKWIKTYGFSSSGWIILSRIYFLITL